MTRDRKSGVASSTIAAILIIVAATPWANADSIIPEQLSTISSVEVTVPTGQLQYDPPPGMDLKAFKASVHAVVGRVLGEEGIQTVESAQQRLTITVSRRSSGDPETDHAYYIEVELTEEAVLTREWRSRCTHVGSLWVATWKDGYLDLIPGNRATEEILEEVEILVTNFAKKVSQAKVHAACCKGGEEQEASVDCGS